MSIPGTPRAKILFVMPNYAGGGAERVALTLLAGLDRATFEPHLSVLDPSGPLKGLVGGDVDLHELGQPHLRRALPALFRLIRRERPAAVFATHGYISVTLLALKRLMPHGTKLVLRESSTPSMSLPNKPRPRLMRRAYSRFYPSVDLMLCQHRLTEREMSKDFGVLKERIVSLLNPVDITALRAAAATPQRIAGSGLRFVAAGRLSPEKGYDRLISLFRDLPKDSHLMIYGGGPELHSLANQIDHLGMENRVSLGGFTDRLPAALAGADACVISSHWEGLPNVALEALAVGTRVIATPESGGIAELASAAGPEAVAIAAWGAPFANAMQHCCPHPKDELAPSLLPVEYAVENVSVTFNSALQRLLGFPDLIDSDPG